MSDDPLGAVPVEPQKMSTQAGPSCRETELLLLREERQQWKVDAAELLILRAERDSDREFYRSIYNSMKTRAEAAERQLAQVRALLERMEQAMAISERQSLKVWAARLRQIVDV